MCRKILQLFLAAVCIGGFSAPPGAIANVVTTSGGNEFHDAIPVYYTNLDMARHQQTDRGAVEQGPQASCRHKNGATGDGKGRR
jgi:hypothetical protein